MLKNFYADAYFENIKDVSPEYLKEKGIEGIILDIDNTLIGHDVPIPDEKTMAHLRLFESAGLKLCVVSNNKYDRVKNFTEKIKELGNFVREYYGCLQKNGADYIRKINENFMV